jgi:hypothetical protein
MNLTPVQNGWLKLADIKTALFNDLQSAELVVQGYTKDLERMSLDEIQFNIKSAKQTFQDAKSRRLEFTRMIDEKLINPTMEFEKRMAANIEAAAAIELDARKKAAAEAEKEQQYMNEVAALKAHVVNEWFRIAAQYRYELNEITFDTYKNCLKARVPKDKIEHMTTDMVDILDRWKLPEFQKFERRFVPDGHAKEIYDSIDKYDPRADLDRAKMNVALIWAAYANDLVNVDATIEYMENEKATKAAEMKSEIALETATNTLIAEAETIIIDTPKVKKELKIVVVESEQWAKTIVANFVRLWPYCNKFVRVKSWSKLTIGQMADALAKHINETGNIIPGVETEEICK